MDDEPIPAGHVAVGQLQTLELCRRSFVVFPVIWTYMHVSHLRPVKMETADRNTLWDVMRESLHCAEELILHYFVETITVRHPPFQLYFSGGFPEAFRDETPNIQQHHRRVALHARILPHAPLPHTHIQRRCGN
ncbi:hypothetical protein Hypma_014027 [Hypsizygus marmoreus]|uniref:Uncharacterized protein n=1 Tax=Hypsizygus marmoreus TaxID=39966 RepID=A0A369KBN5_HYPMA|nr:hypothetical protein Hypma_014027 [Hypsizygus marmoreus]